ncbi:DUF2165 family protein [Roseobacter sp. EG26]|uniref:DUF2165 family protein n=1 Tax=Roseobacter sp. EG26 TaxID=3412477 RepID=UPI003CE4E092
MEATLLLAQAVATGLIALWLTLGLKDNFLHPSVNEKYTAEVLAMTRMRAQYPEEFKTVAHRAITNRQTQQFAFRCVLVAEFVTCILLWLGVLGLLISISNPDALEAARIIAMLGALSFTAIWAGFLIVGNHFCYWFCHEGAQNTHFQMTLWGLATLILISQS